ncbi:MAG: type III-B CRISPR module-associated protein Cmr3 [Chloroflexales bacterium]
MSIWLIEPRDPLIVRDGRPFGPNPGARAATLPFPLPSTIVGGLRHKAGIDDTGAFDRTAIARVLGLTLRGPLLAELNEETGAIKQFLFPAPADALVLDPLDSDKRPEGEQPHGEVHVRVQRLAPRTLSGAPKTNQPDGLDLIGPPKRVPNKVSSKAPRFWHEQAFMAWLTAPAEDATGPLRELGLGAMESDARTHVSVQSETQTAREGALFQTQGLEFTWRDREAAKHDQFLTRRLALAAAFEKETQPYTPAPFTGGIAPLGGERRLMRWSIVDSSLPKPPDGLFDVLIAARRARVILLTPALFGLAGADHPGKHAAYRPPLQWIRGGVVATLKAAAVPRAQVVSGWDMNADNGLGKSRGKPKRTRRLAPVGAVYFIEWSTNADVLAWLNATWMQNVSEDEQDQRDGFGLAAIGVWPQSDEEQP